MGLFKSKDKNMYIAFGVVVVLLIAVIVWMYMSRDKGMSLDGEAEAVRQELQRLAASQPQPSAPPKESYAPPPPPAQKPALVVFHADFCGFCKQFMPVWQELKSKIPQDKLTLLDFQMEKEPEIIQQNDVKGFPDIRLYPQGFPSQNYVSYQGNRQPDSIMRFVMSGGQSS